MAFSYYDRRDYDREDIMQIKIMQEEQKRNAALLNMQLDQMQQAMHPLFMSQQSPQTHMTAYTNHSSSPIIDGRTYNPGHGSITPVRDLPMGIGEWESHGKRHGYWDYYERQVLEKHGHGAQQPTTGVAHVLFGGTMLSRGSRGETKVEVVPPPNAPDDKVKVDGKIEIGDKVSIKKHEPIIVK